MSLNVRTRIGLVFAAALGTLMVVLLSLFAAYQLARNENNEIKTVHLPSVQASEELNALVQTLVLDQLIFITDPASRSKVGPRTNEAQAEFERQFAIASRLADTPGEHDLVTRIRQEADEFFALSRRYETLVAQNKAADARRLHKFAGAPIYDRLHKDTLALYRSNVDEVNTMRDRAFVRSDRLQAFSVLFAVLGACAAALVWRSAARQIVGPLRSLQTTARALEAGRFEEDHDPYAAHTKELATLQHSFNRMSNQLKEMTGRLEAQVAERTQALQDANAQLQRLVAELQTLDELKSQFMAVMSHELLTPINFIVGFGSALDDELMGPLNDQQHETLAKMLAGAERLTRMVRNTLEYSQLQVGRLDFFPKAIDYASVVDDARERLADRLARRHQALDVALPEGPIALWADPDRTRQILDELLDNASKFSPEGARLSLRVMVGDDIVTTEIADTGVGIPDEALPHLFTPFYQADFSRTREHGGMGLGLAIAYHLVARMGGSMLVSSAPQAGTTIRFTLPRSEKAARPALEATRAAQG